MLSLAPLVVLVLALSTGTHAGLFTQLRERYRAFDASDEARASTFGASVAISSDGSVALVGSPSETVNGVHNVGMCRVYAFEKDLWRPKTKFNDPSLSTDSFQGVSVGISHNGTTMLMSAHRCYNNEGCIYVFRYDGGAKVAFHQLLQESEGQMEEDAFFGLVARMSDDASTVCGSRAGTVARFITCFRLDALTDRYEPLTPTPARVEGFYFERNLIDLSSDGSVLLVGQPKLNEDTSDGRVYVYKYDPATRTYAADNMDVARLDPSLHLGAHVTVSADGQTLIVGAWGLVQIYQKSSGGDRYTLFQTIDDVIGDDDSTHYFGYDESAISTDGLTLLVSDIGKNRKGGAFAFTRSSVQAQFQPLQAFLSGYDPDARPNERQAASLALSGDGTKFLMSAGNPQGKLGGVWFFDSVVVVDPCSDDAVPDPEIALPSHSQYVQVGGKHRTFSASSQDVRKQGRYGLAVSMSGDGTVAVVGSPNEWDDAKYEGAMRIYAFQQDQWVSKTRVDVPSMPERAFQGWSVDLTTDGRVIVMGVPGYKEDEGAIFVFLFDGETATQRQILREASRSESGFGSEVTISGNGKIICGGRGYEAGPITCFRKKEGVADQYDALPQTVNVPQGENGFFANGRSLDLSDDGKVLVVGHYRYATRPAVDGETTTYDGNFFVYEYQEEASANRFVESTVAQKVGISPGSQYGIQVGISGDGRVIIVGVGADAGTVHVYQRIPPATQFTHFQTIARGDTLNEASASFGYNGRALSHDGTVLVIGDTHSEVLLGGLFLFNRSSAEEPFAWSAPFITGSEPSGDDYESQGFSISMSDDGQRFMMGSSNFYEPLGGVWFFDSNSSLIPVTGAPSRAPTCSRREPVDVDASDETLPPSSASTASLSAFILALVGAMGFLMAIPLP